MFWMASAIFERESTVCPYSISNIFIFTSLIISTFVFSILFTKQPDRVPVTAPNNVPTVDTAVLVEASLARPKVSRYGLKKKEREESWEAEKEEVLIREKEGEGGEKMDIWGKGLGWI